MSEHLGPSDFSHWLDQAHRQKICHILLKKYVSLTETDMDDVWSDVQKDLFAKWPPDNRLDSEASLEGLLFTIADRRACDLVRRNDAQRRMLERCHEIAEADAGQAGEASVRNECDQLEYEELQGFVIEAFRLLAPDEWMVLSVYCEEYPKLRGPRQLLDALQEEFPEVVRRGWTPATVGRLLNQARSIVQEYLSQKGYDRDCKA